MLLLEINLDRNQENLTLKIGCITHSLSRIGQIILLFYDKFIICLFHMGMLIINLLIFSALSI